MLILFKVVSRVIEMGRKQSQAFASSLEKNKEKGGECWKKSEEREGQILKWVPLTHPVTSFWPTFTVFWFKPYPLFPHEIGVLTIFLV